jgi:hypothetical protein
VCLVVAALTAAQKVEAAPFIITSTLLGDFRAENPDGIIIDVTVTGDTTSNVVDWTVDINSPLHPNATLGAFAFNLLVNPALVTFSNFSPAAWSVTTPGNNIPGSGGADFVFQSLDPAGSSNNVTNSVNLTFRATLSSGTWSTAMFTDAALSDGGGIPGPGTQLGAHVRSLSTAGCTDCSDSGFASGNYSVPEPTTLLFTGLGLLSVGLLRRKKA